MDCAICSGPEVWCQHWVQQAGAEAASEKVAAESEMVADESDADAEAEPLHLDCPDPNNLEALDLLKISIMKRPRSFEAVDGDTATAL